MPTSQNKYGRRELALLSHTFGINHAAVTTPILYQTTYMGSHLGNLNNALLYIITMFTALLLAPVLNDKLGARVGLSLTMLGYAIYVTFFSIGLLCEHQNVYDVSDPTKKIDVDPGALMYFFGIFGSVIGGLSAGPLWTFQGVVVGKMVDGITEDEGRVKSDVSSEMLATFGFWFLFWEAVLRAATTAMLKVQVPPAAIFFIFGGLAALASAVFFRLMPVGADAKPAQGRACAKASQAIALWSDPTIWLLQFTNLTFGFGAAWNASYVGTQFTSKALSPQWIGFTGALISLIGGVGSRILGPLAKMTGKPVIILIGSVAFFGIAFLSKTIPDGSQMGLGVLIFPVLMGLGRAVYESTNKGVFIDFFPNPESHPGVFGNVMVFGTLSSAAVFIIDMAKAQDTVIYLLFLFSVCTFPSIALAGCLKTRLNGSKDSPLAEC